MDYIIYTTEGYTQSPTNQDVENCQIIDFLDNDNSNKAEVLSEYLQHDKYPIETGFDRDKMKVVSCIDDETLAALRNVVSYLWKNEKRHYEECPYSEKENHIFNQIITLAYYLDKDNNYLVDM